MELQPYDAKYSLPPNGFDNLGFTCYYNALLQSLLSCTSFVQEILKGPYKKGYADDLLLRLLHRVVSLELSKDLTEEVKEEIKHLGPTTWKAMIKKLASKSREFAQFAFGQQCAAEGFSLILQSLEEYANIQNLFLHRRKNRIYCGDCKTYFSTVEEINNLFEVEVAEVAEVSKQRNLNEFLLTQQNKIDENCICTNCQTRGEKLKISTLVMIPEILFVMSKKYKFLDGHGEKLDVYTDFPEYLSFKSKNNSELRYAACAQIQHYGSLSSGHYLAICKRQNRWYCLNDAGVSPAEYKPDNNTYIVLYHLV